MREMKDSGVEWIGKIPNAWTLEKVKFNFTIAGGCGFKDIYQGLEDGDYPFCKASDINGKDKYLNTAVNYVMHSLVLREHYNLIPINSILFAKIGEALKKNHRKINKVICIVDNNCEALVKNKNNEIDYMYYLFSQVDMIWFDNAGTIPCINNQKLLNSFIPIPPISEQKKIATFLDKKCGEVDAIIENIQKQIEILEKYKRSIITEAVTKGLNPQAEMKDSGLDWIGKIPSHWTIEKFKYHLRRFEPRNPGHQKVLSLYREFGVIPKDSRDDNHNITSEDTSKYKYVKPGDFVINKMKAWQGSVAVSDYEGIISPAYFVYKFTDNVFFKKYFHYLLRGCYKDEFRRLSGGIREGQ